MAQFCGQCGTRLRDNPTFCTNCGARTEMDEAPSGPAISTPGTPYGPSGTSGLMPKMDRPDPSRGVFDQASVPPPGPPFEGPARRRFNRTIGIAAGVVIALLALLVVAVLLNARGSGDLAIKSADLAVAVKQDGNKFTGIDKTDTFTRGQPLHAVVQVQGSDKNPRVRAVWTAVDVPAGPVSLKNRQIDEKQVTLDKNHGVADLTGSAVTTAAPGTYKVEIYLNDTLERTLNYTVKA
jgi:hypothetical protein